MTECTLRALLDCSPNEVMSVVSSIVLFVLVAVIVLRKG